MKKIFSLCFFLLMAISLIAQKKTSDTSKWNGVWDPNDPNCPCYKIQKQAEKEYQEMQKEEQKKKDPNPELKNNQTDPAEIKVIKHKGTRKRKKASERKYKRGKAVCPDV